MKRNWMGVAIATMLMVPTMVVHAQGKTRAEVKAEAKQAPMGGAAQAETYTPPRASKSGTSRAAVKAEAKADPNKGNEATTYALPAAKGTKSRAEVKADRKVPSTVDTAKTYSPDAKKP